MNQPMASERPRAADPGGLGHLCLRHKCKQAAAGIGLSYAFPGARIFAITCSSRCLPDPPLPVLWGSSEGLAGAWAVIGKKECAPESFMNLRSLIF